MPEFDTPEPISVNLEFDIGSVRITASKRATTVVTVQPSSPTEEADVRAAQQTKVGYTDGTLLIKGPRKRSLFGRSGSLDISIALPTGSAIHGNSPMADFTGEGRLGDCTLKTSAGDIQLDEAAGVRLRTAHGRVQVDRVAGDAEVTGSGRVAIGEVTGTATVKNLNGETVVGEVTGDLRVNSSNGRIVVGIARSGVQAKSAHGDIRVDDVARGQILLQTGAGDLEVGIREATAAWLDVNTGLGRVHNTLGATDGPEATDETVEVRARTGLGDITIRRA
ncbi:DUF4097 family beta strand repeat-containing protein [Kitasatospora sp. GAS204B]|uniref:DUF4097 family beta strand repeat-containing protein n=1 Tax=unclassified Kitasatospora TaxID=2633591 RepID=UPI0024769C80|nr:DUF4097 family beta strand repeat-containing protein [Kitasatospora sp. GAS204B]MDH6120767.1 DUF4097 and DUF4098 domain-containing protein YvlB [Kitasatospora sp. GAS204B]